MNSRADNKSRADDKCKQDLQNILKARFPLIFLRSAEESRAIKCIIDAHQALVSKFKMKDGELIRWSSVSGFVRHFPQPENPNRFRWEEIDYAKKSGKNSFDESLSFLHKRLQTEAIQKPNCQFTYLLPDWSTFIKPDDEFVARKIKELVISIQQRKTRPRMTLIILGLDWSIPPILRNYVHIVDLSLPNEEELYQDLFSKNIPKPEDARSLSVQAQGMTRQAVVQLVELMKAQNLLSNFQEAKRLLVEIKQQEIRKTGVLEYYPPQDGGLEDVGGLDQLKQWIRQRQGWFLQNDFAELRPRAILLEGFPGCGKSFIAKAIAQEWGVPQINFEISRLRSKYVGETESKTFQALRALEASAPNILFMDEIEKAFAGAGSDGSEITMRQFGTFLSWLNDHTYPIFFITTSNNTKRLPPELFRAGRFDERFIITPPNSTERSEILINRVKAHKLLDLEEELLKELVEKTEGFTGAEIDKLVREAIYQAHIEPQITGFLKQPNKENWYNALKLVNPQINSPKMKKLLKQYIDRINNKESKSASIEDPEFWNRLLPKKED